MGCLFLLEKLAKSVLGLSSIADPGSGAFFTSGSRIRAGKSRELINNFVGSKILKFFDADPGSEIFSTLDPGFG